MIKVGLFTYCLRKIPLNDWKIRQIRSNEHHTSSMTRRARYASMQMK